MKSKAGHNCPHRRVLPGEQRLEAPKRIEHRADRQGEHHAAAQPAGDDVGAHPVRVTGARDGSGGSSGPPFFLVTPPGMPPRWRLPGPPSWTSGRSAGSCERRRDPTGAALRTDFSRLKPCGLRTYAADQRDGSNRERLGADDLRAVGEGEKIRVGLDHLDVSVIGPQLGRIRRSVDN